MTMIDEVKRSTEFLGAHIHDTVFAETLARRGYPITTAEEFAKAARLAEHLAEAETRKVASTPSAFDKGLTAAGIGREPVVPDFTKYAVDLVRDPDILAAATRIVIHDAAATARR